MDIKFNKDSADNQQAGADGKGKQNALLVVLLVLAGVVAYIYFFTGLIKPMQEQKSAEAPPPAAQVTKIPLPPADGTPAKAKADAGAELKKDAAEPAAASAPVAAAKPAVQETAKVKEEQKSTGEAVPSIKKPLPTAGKVTVKKPTPPEKKEPVAVVSKPQPAKVVEKKPVEVKKPVEKPAAPATVAVKAKKEALVSGKVIGSGPWTVLVGNYVLEEALATDLARVRKAGLEAFVVPGSQKKTHMNRLLLAEFTDRESAQAELNKLKRLTADAFIIDNAGMHAVYAGSYLLAERAGSEMERLAAAGFKLTLKRADVSIPTKNLTAGSFAEKSAAEGTLKKLRSAGVKAALTRQ